MIMDMDADLYKPAIQPTQALLGSGAVTYLFGAGIESEYRSSQTKHQVSPEAWPVTAEIPLHCFYPV